MAWNANADKLISHFDKYIRTVEPELASGYDKVKDKIFIQATTVRDVLYYRTIFHELIHWTGHYTRLDRDYVYLTEEARDIGYVREEIIAEIASAHICNRFEILVPLEDVKEYLMPYVAHIMQYIDTSFQDEWDRTQVDVRHAINYLYDYIENNA